MQYLEQVQRGIDFIEARLDQEEVPFEAIAQAAGLSAWHFQRIFKAITHETLKGYIRSRRLAHACASLVGTKRRILDIALLAGYDSQESFTRAFKHQHGVTPGEFRRARALRQEHKKVSIDAAYLSHLQTGVVTEPVFRHWPARRYVGLQTAFYGVCSDKNDLALRIPPLWDAFLRRLPEVACPVPGVCYGLVDQDPRDAERLSYCSAIEVDAIERIPDGMRVVAIEAQTYAVFRHVGAPEQLDNTVNYIYSNWLHTAGWRHTQSADIECYGPDYLPGTDTCVTEYAIPVSR